MMCALLAGSSLQAATRTWVGNTSADWNTAGNWSGAVPGSSDTAVFNSATANYSNITFATGSSLLTLSFSGTPESFTIGTTGGSILTLASGGSVTIGSTVTSSQTINAPLIIGTTYGFYNNAASSNATLNFGGSVTGAASATTLTLGGSNTGLNAITGNIVNGSAALGLTKVGTGTWVLGGNNTYTGATILRSGTVILDYTTNTGNKLGSSSALTFGGTSLQLKGGSGVESVASTNFNGGGQASISRLAGSTQTISLGAVSNGFTSGTGLATTANFQSGVAYTSNTTANTSNGTGSLLNSSGYAVVGSQGAADWASVNSSGAIVGFSEVNTAGYTALAATNNAATSQNFIVNNSLTTAQTGVYTLKITADTNAGSTPTLTLTSNLTLGANGGILDSASSTNTYLITGGSITLGGSGTSIQQYGNGTLQIDSQILGSSGIYFQKGGAGTLVLSGNNAWKTTFTINQGTVSVASDANLGGNSGSVTVTGSGTATSTQSYVTLSSAAPSTFVLGSNILGFTVTAISADRLTVTLSGSLSSSITAPTSAAYAIAAGIVLNGGTLQATDTFTLAETGATTINRTVALGGNGGTFDIAAGKTLTTPGVVSNLVSTVSSALTKTGKGTLVLSGSNTYTGGTAITQGKLLVSNTTGSGTGTGAVALGAATLAGTGTVSGMVTSSGIDGTIGSDDSIGKLTLGGGLDATNGITFALQLGTTSDLIVITGVFTGSNAANGLRFAFEDAGGITYGVAYTLLTFTSSTNLDYSDLLASALPSGYVLDSNFGTDGFLITATGVEVQFSSVPEPGTWLLMALGGLILVLSRSFQRRRAA
jgi:fibronectin-binding autotransporter adhesin